MTHVSDLVQMTIAAPLGDSGDASLSIVISMAQAVPNLCVRRNLFLKHQVKLIGLTNIWKHWQHCWLPYIWSGLPEWQERVVMVLNWSIFNCKCEKMYNVWSLIANWHVTTVDTPGSSHRHFVKPENTSTVNNHVHHHRHHETECVFVSRIKN